MGYTPLNDCVYAKAFMGCLTALGGGGRYLDAVAADESAYARMADAYAQEFDTVWGAAAPTALEEDGIFGASFALWRTRSPLENGVAFLPGAYSAIVRGAIALVQEGNAQVVGEGIDPNGCAAGGGGFPPGTGAVVETGGVPAVANGPAGQVLTSNGPGVAPSFQSTIVPRQAVGPVAFIDPANSTGFAVDTNTGATANNVPAGSGPILTTQHLSDLLFNRKLTADRTITYMSDDASGVGLDYANLATNGFTLTFQGTPQVLHTGGTINAGTIAMNPAAAGGGQRQVAHTSDLATFNPFVFTTFGGAATNPARITDTVTGAGSWVVTDTTPAAPSVTSPTNPDGTAGVLTIGDAYRITRGSILKLAATVQPTLSGLTGGVILNDFAFTSDSVGPDVGTSTDIVFVFGYNRCSFLATVSVSGFYSDCAFMSGASGDITVFVNSGLYVPNSSTGELSGLLAMGGNCYIAQPTIFNAFELGSVSIRSLFVFEDTAGAGGIQIQDSADAGIRILQGATFQCAVLMWGNGNATQGVLVGTGANVAIGTSAVPPTVTGTGGDFGFTPPAGGATSTVARAFNPATGAFTEAGGVATRTCTWVHLSGTIAGGGFGDNAQLPEASSALMIGP